MEESKKQRLRAFGFNAHVDRIEMCLCAECGSDKVKPEDFRDRLSRKEFEISALCQECQDKQFGK